MNIWYLHALDQLNRFLVFEKIRSEPPKKPQVKLADPQGKLGSRDKNRWDQKPYLSQMTSRLSIKVDAGVGAFSVSPSGRDIALASQNGLHIVDLEAPFTPPRWLPLHTIWEVADVQWCHHPSHPTWIVSTSNQKAILWNLALPSHRAIEHVLHGHNRAITDINFSTIRRDVLATCSVDTRVLVWDTRNTAKPAIKFADFDAGATQVRWNKINQHVLASAHHRRIVVWDDRKNNIPLYTVEAHTGQVNGLDWEFKSANRIMSCSTDREVKVWDLTSSTTEPITDIVTTFPVWRAKYMPRGPGCLIAPLRGGGNSAYLADLKDAGSKADLPAITKLTFDGHSEPVKEIGLRRQGDGFELVTLSKDHHLNLWPITREDLTLVEFPVEEMPPFPRRDVTFHDEPEIHSRRLSANNDSFKPLVIRDETHRSGNGHLDWISRVQLMSNVGVDKEVLHHTHVNISKEVTRMGTKFPKLHFENIDLATGTCTLTLRGPWAPKEELTTLRVTFMFPPDYPLSPLAVALEEHLSIEPEKLAGIEAHLREATATLARHSQGSFEYCLRYLMGDRVSLDMLVQDPALDPLVYSALSDSENEHSDDGSVASSPPSVDYNDDEFGDDFMFAEGSGQAVGPVLTADDVFISKPQMDSTPLPKQCGAVWTPHGKLLCFFNHNKAKQSYQTPLPLDRIFAGDDSDSEDVYESDSDEFMADDPARHNWSSTAAKLTAMLHINGSISEGTGRRDSLGTGSQTSMSGQTSNTGPRNHVVTIDFSHLIPSSVELAKQYSLDLGSDPVELATANAEIAEKAGRPFDAYLWRFVLYLTTSDEKFDPSVMFSGFSSFVLREPIWDWTGSPYGGFTVGQHLTEYLERTQNLQLLGSLSLLFVEVCYGPYRGYPTIPVLRDKTSGQRDEGEKVFNMKMAANAPAGSSIEVITTTNEPSVKVSMEREPLTTQMRAEPSPSINVSGTPIVSTTISSGTSYSDTPSPCRPTTIGMSQAESSVYAQSQQSGPNTPYGSHPRSFSEHDGSTSLGFFDYVNSSRPRLLRNRSSESGPRSETGSAHGSSSTVPTLNRPGGDAVHTSIRLVTKAPYSNECIGDFMSSDDYETIFLGWQMAFTRYRTLYARLLEQWGLHDKRLEMLKHNYYQESKHRDEKQKVDEYQAIVELVGEGNRQCRFCERSVSKQFIQCRNCNHILHRQCADEWWGNGQGDECPSGCGCKCIDYI